MVTLYIDDSGSSKATDKDQPIFLFSGICVNNIEYHKANNFMNKLILDTDKLLFNKIVGAFDLGSRKYNQAMATDIKKSLCSKFELHASEIIHGKKINRLLSKEEKINILEKIFNFIKDNNINVLIVKCEKSKLDMTLKKDLLQKDLETKVMDGLISLYSQHLQTINRKGVLIFDKGNDIINGNFPEYFTSHLDTSNNHHINPNVIQLDSKDVPLIQMADFTAYIANAYFNSKSNSYHNDLKVYYEMIEDNITILDVSETQTEGA